MIAYMSAAALSQGQKQTLRQLYDKYGKKMYSAAKRILSDVTLAEDAVQNAFVAVAESMDLISDKSDGALEGYMTVIAKNEAYNILRKREKAAPTDELPDTEDTGAAVDITVSDREAAELAVNIIRAMDDNYRAPLYLYCVMGFTPGQIAKQLHKNENTVRSLIRRGRDIIIKKLRESGYEY